MMEKVGRNDSRMHVLVGRFLHSETGEPLYALSALYEPFPQVLVIGEVGTLKDWSHIVQPPPTVQPGIYRHFKGGKYRVFGEFVHAVSGESHVAYICLYGQYAMLVRPTAMFTEYVESNEFDYEGTRFTFDRP